MVKQYLQYILGRFVLARLGFAQANSLSHIHRSCFSRDCLLFVRKGCSELLTTMALRKGSLDNTSAMVVDLRGLWDVDGGAQPKRTGKVAVAAMEAESAGTAILRQELKALSPSYSSSKQTLVNGGGSRGNGVESDSVGAAGTADRSRPSSSPGLWALSQVHVL